MVLLPWNPPYDWAWMVGFLQARAVAGVERFDEGGYSRSWHCRASRADSSGTGRGGAGPAGDPPRGCNRWRRSAMRELASCLI